MFNYIRLLETSGLTSEHSYDKSIKYVNEKCSEIRSHYHHGECINGFVYEQAHMPPSESAILAIMQVLTVNKDIVELYQSRGVDPMEVMRIFSMAMDFRRVLDLPQVK